MPIINLVIKLNFVPTLSTRLGQEFEVEVQANFRNWSLISILLLRLGEVMKWMFGQDFEVKMLMFSWDFEFWNLIKIYVRSCYFGKQNSTLGSVVPLAMFNFMLKSPISRSKTCNTDFWIQNDPLPLPHIWKFFENSSVTSSVPKAYM